MAVRNGDRDRAKFCIGTRKFDANQSEYFLYFSAQKNNFGVGNFIKAIFI